MCRVLGITHFDYVKHEQIVARFCELARSGQVMAEDPPGHEDGWGLAFYQNGKLVVHKSGVNLLKETDKVIGILSTARTSPLMILHLRKSAWTDTSNIRHAHPFYLGNSVFFHNGVVYDYQGLIPDISLPGLGADARDTEVFFYHVMSGKARELGQDFLDTATVIQQRHKFSALNCLFSDGVKLFAYRDFTKEPDYYSLYKAYAEDSCFISSEPLDERLQWAMMAKEEFLSIELGGRV
ncbi:class II glutamine amidotransferase [Geopsychrobacter electrodiphilus]|uniref:class II glutamine amidotransferase n=1 Tax=Geopsychrobacter electrodiphilus TaxID=225196 RepID=UPI000381F710|nr:class II glutamine amidotransferase [Geopsychrobacter electrodiphilus]